MGFAPGDSKVVRRERGEFCAGGADKAVYSECEKAGEHFYFQPFHGSKRGSKEEFGGEPI